MQSRFRALVDPVRWIVRREKLCVYLRCPYRKPTQVDEERILRPAGEGLLRNSANWSRNFGRRDATLCVAAVNRPKQLFIKNTGLCKLERGRIGADACPVPEG